jgi:uncharacterized protein (DUF2384 family)
MLKAKDNNGLSFIQDNSAASLDAIAKRFGMSKIQLAETLGLKQSTLYRSARLNSAKVQTRIREMLEIIALIIDWAGGEKQAMAWYRAEKIPSFGGRTAEFLVQEGRSALVRDYIDRIALGGFA